MKRKVGYLNLVKDCLIVFKNLQNIQKNTRHIYLQKYVLLMNERHTTKNKRLEKYHPKNLPEEKRDKSKTLNVT